MKQTKESNLCLAGGVALNCVANTILFRSGLFKNIWVQPAAGDAGGALGAALAVSYLHLKIKRKIVQPDAMKGSLLGPSFSHHEIELKLSKNEDVKYHLLPDEELVKKTASALLDGKVIGWFQGRMEFGPRALGCRSILASATNPEMQSRVNMKIKFRESFRPFAPAVLWEDAPRIFELGVYSPYMLFIDYFKKELRNPLPAKNSNWEDKLTHPKTPYPSVTHADYSARLQTVDSSSHPLFLRLLKEIKKLTGTGILLNTSFNIRGEPIVCTPQDALQCFLKTEMDLLVIGNFMVEKRFSK